MLLERKMFHKSAVAVIVALATGSAYSYHSDAGHTDKGAVTAQISSKLNAKQQARLNADERSIYIIHFDDAPVALYNGDQVILGAKGKSPSQVPMAATNPNGKKLDLRKASVQRYRQHIETQQNNFVEQAKRKVLNFSPLISYQLAFNGMAVMLTAQEAQAIADLPYVSKVEQDKKFALHTDTGPQLIGAPDVWSGQAVSSGVGSFGEGIVVGIIDSGINTDHPSFADVASDSFDHTNPLGNGNYLGDCAGAYPELCNDKLIGVYSYPVITSTYTDTEIFPPNLAPNGEDYGGHGTHVAGTAAGNILLDAPESLPEFDAVESSGIATGFTFDRVSGVAPRANIISYQVCWGGRSDAGDTYGDCTGAAITAAIEDAIEDQVDVINYSISGGGQPWNSSTERAFLAARNAGIFVATSAGNGGPAPSTTVKDAPWYTAVAASEHGRSINYSKTIGSFSGGASSLNDISGVSNSGAITAPIVYAGDFANPNDPGNDSAQCLQPFPAGTFSGQIVVCDRGEIARVQKAVNVRDGGAGGYVLANVTGGTNNIVADSYVVPGIHITSGNGALLRSWLASGSGHTATITATSGELTINPDREDVLASFSSKGPNSSISTLTPTIGGPGVRIYAAYADQQFGHDGHEPAAGDYNYLSGTSMSSPHIAGAAALVKGVHPSWTPDNIRSALAMTASRTVKKEDGSTTADWFDSGSGRVQVDLAVEAGLVLDETATNYQNANPLTGGDPRSLNLPSITDNNCASTCTWERTFTATKAGTWQVSTEQITNGMTIAVTPSTFSLAVGETQTVSVSMDVSTVSTSNWQFGAINLESNGQPDLHLPVSVKPSTGNLPEQLVVNARRSADSLLIEDAESLTQNNFTATVLGFSKATNVTSSLEQDSAPGDLFDDITDGIEIFEIQATSSTQQIVANTLESSASDIDLYLVFDANGDDQPEAGEIVDFSITNGVIENINITDVEAGKYWLMVQSFASSTTGASDSYRLSYAAVEAPSDDLSLNVEVPSSTVATEAFDMRLNWDLGNAAPDDSFYGIIGFGTNDNPSAIQTTFVEVLRQENDVQFAADSPAINIGLPSAFTISVLGTDSPEDRDYEITLPIPSGFSLVQDSVGQGGAISDSSVTWNVTRQSSSDADEELTFELIPQPTVTENDLNFSISSDVTNVAAAQEEDSNLETPLQLDLPPEILIDGQESISVNVFETQALSITAEVSDPNGESLTVQWEQIEGPTLTLSDDTTETVTLRAPSVDNNSTAILQATVSDNQGNTDTATVTVVINNNEAPVLSVNAPSTVVGGNSYTITASATDAEGDTVAITIGGSPGTSYTRTAPNAAQTLNIAVVARDGINTVTETVTISVSAAPSTNTGGGSGGGGGGGGSSSLLMLALLPVIWIRRRLGS